MRAFREPKNRNFPVNFLIIIQCKINIINLILLIKDSGKIETIIGNCCYENRTYIGYSKWAYCLCNLMMGWWRVRLTIGLRFDLDSSRDEVISTNIEVWTGNWQGNSFSSVRGNPFAEIPAIYFNFVPWFSRNRIKFRLSWKLLSTLVQDSQWAQSLSKGLYLSLFALYYVNEIMERNMEIYITGWGISANQRKGIPLSTSCSHLSIRWNYFIATIVKVKPARRPT